MKKIPYLLILLIFSMILAYSQSGLFRNPVVREIQFEGLVNTSYQEARRYVDFKVGDVINEITLNSSIKKLFSLDRFQSAVADVTEISNGLIVKFIVTENPYIRNVLFEGNNAVRRDDMMEKIPLTDESYFTEGKLSRSLAAILAKYREDGYLDASVHHKLKVVNIKKNIYDLVFQVNEQSRILIEKVVITGNTNLTSAELKNVMKSKEPFLFFTSGVLKEKDFAEDRQNLQYLYWQKGFLDAELKRFEWKIEELGENKHKAIVVYLDVFEGNRYYVGKFSVVSNTIYSSNELLSVVDLKSGDVYDRMKVEMIRYNMFTKYGNTGHLYANVIMNTNVNPSNNVIDTEFVVIEGPLAHIESVTVSGNNKTLEDVIRREFIFSEGELYIDRKVRNTQDKLMQLQFFSDVKVNKLPGSAEGLVNLDVYAEDQRTGMVTFGLGYGTESGFSTSAQLSEKNLFGTGRGASLTFNYGETKQSIELGYNEPWINGWPLTGSLAMGFSKYRYTVAKDDDHNGVIDGTNIDYTVDTNATLGDVDTFDEGYYYRDTLYLSGSLNRSFAIFWNASVGAAFTVYRDVLDSFDLENLFMNSAFSTGRYHVSPTLKYPLTLGDYWEVNQDLIDSIAKGWQFKNDLWFGIGHNSTANQLAPTYGTKFNQNLWYYGGLLGGTSHFIKSATSFDHYISPFWKTVIAFHASTEILFPQFGASAPVYDDDDEMDFDGTYEMRGWTSYSKVGAAKFFTSIEYRIPIFWEIWGAFFCDVGNIWTKYQDWAPWKPEGYIGSFGVGFHVNFSMFPIRFYLARQFYYDSDTSQVKFYSSENFFDNWQPVLSIQGLF